jgi:hypothetical protein
MFLPDKHPKNDQFEAEQIDENSYAGNPPNCAGGICEFDCASFFVSLLSASLRNSSPSLTLQ